MSHAFHFFINGTSCGPIHGSLVHLVKQVCMGQEGLTGLGAAARRHNDGVQRECFTIRNMVKRSLAWQENLLLAWCWVENKAGRCPAFEGPELDVLFHGTPSILPCKIPCIQSWQNWLSGRMWPLDNRCCLPPALACLAVALEVLPVLGWPAVLLGSALLLLCSRP